MFRMTEYDKAPVRLIRLKDAAAVCPTHLWSLPVAEPPCINPCGLFLEAVCSAPVAVISFHERKRRQPGFAAGRPEFVGWYQLGGNIERPEVHFDLVSIACENGEPQRGQKKRPA